MYLRKCRWVWRPLIGCVRSSCCQVSVTSVNEGATPPHLQQQPQRCPNRRQQVQQQSISDMAVDAVDCGLTAAGLLEPHTHLRAFPRRRVARGRDMNDLMRTKGANVRSAGYQMRRLAAADRGGLRQRSRQRLSSSAFSASPLIGSARAVLAVLRASGRW